MSRVIPRNPYQCAVHIPAPRRLNARQLEDLRRKRRLGTLLPARVTVPRWNTRRFLLAIVAGVAMGLLLSLDFWG